MGEVRDGAAGGGTDRPPSPEGVSTLDELAARLRDLRAWAGNPSFTRLVKDVAAVRAARGLPGDERPGRVTVYECFRSGRRRVDVELLVDIVAALGVDRAGQVAWHCAHRVVSSSATPVPRLSLEASAHVVKVLLDALQQDRRCRVANLVGPVGAARSAVLAALPVDALRVDLAVDDAGPALHTALADPRDLVIVDNADSPAALTAVGAALGRHRQARAVVTSRQPLVDCPGTPASLVPEIVVVPAAVRAGETATKTVPRSSGWTRRLGPALVRPRSYRRTLASSPVGSVSWPR